MARLTLKRGLVQLIDAQVSTTGGNTSFTAGSLSYTREEVTAGTYNIPAGAYTVRGRNTGFESITVNGKSVSPNGHFNIDMEFNKISNVQDFAPAISIVVPVNGSCWYETIFPS